jgi:hypothetical protein
VQLPLHPATTARSRPHGTRHDEGRWLSIRRQRFDYGPPKVTRSVGGQKYSGPNLAVALSFAAPDTSPKASMAAAEILERLLA